MRCEFCGQEEAKYRIEEQEPPWRELRIGEECKNKNRFQDGKWDVVKLEDI